MGCDIHAIIEYNIEGRWKSALFGTKMALPRYYAMFGAMAGVRDLSIEPVAEQRGLPPDGDHYAHCSLKDSADHSFSWLTSTEFEEAIKRGYGGHEYKAVLAMMRSFESSGFPARIVFGFDS